MAQSYAERNAAAIRAGYKSLYDMRKAKSAAASKGAMTELNQILAQGNNPVAPNFQAIGNNLAAQRDAILATPPRIPAAGTFPPQTVPGWTAPPFEGQLALPAAGPTSTGPSEIAARGAAARVAPEVVNVTNPVRAMAAQYPQLEAIAARSAGAAPGQLMTLTRGPVAGQLALPSGVSTTPGVAGSVPSSALFGSGQTVMSGPIAAQAAQAAQAPGAGTIMSSVTGAAGASGAGGVAPSGFLTGVPGLASSGASAASAAAPLLSWGNTGRLVAVGGKAGALRAAGLAGAGLMAGGFADNLNIGGENSNWDRGISGAVRGAGIGAGVGSIVPVIGTGVGAAIGGAAGAAINIFGPKQNKTKEFVSEAAKQQSALSAIADAHGLDAATKQQLLDAYNADVQTLGILGGKSPDKKAIAGLVSQYVGQIPAVAQQRQTMNQAALGALAMQSQIGDYMKPYIDNATAASNANASYYNSLAAKYASNPMADYYKAMASNENSFAAKNAQAWASSTQLLPTVQALAQAQQMAQNPVPQFVSALGNVGSIPTATR